MMLSRSIETMICTRDGENEAVGEIKGGWGALWSENLVLSLSRRFQRILYTEINRRKLATQVQCPSA